MYEPTRPPNPYPIHPKRPPLFSRRALFPAFIALCMTATFGTVVSFLPLLVQTYHLGNPGLFFTVYSVVVVLSRPWAGRWSDRFGRAAVIIPGMMVLAASMAVLAYTTSRQGLLWAAMLQGLGFGAVHPAIMALVVDRSTPQERGAALATLMGAFDVGVGIGAMGLGLVLEYTDFTVTFLCAGGLALMGAGAYIGLGLCPTLYRLGKYHPPAEEDLSRVEFPEVKDV